MFHIPSLGKRLLRGGSFPNLNGYMEGEYKVHLTPVLCGVANPTTGCLDPVELAGPLVDEAV